VSKLKKDIYVIKNDMNNKVYVGQAIDAKIRFQSHCKPSSASYSLISKAIQKYGREHFTYKIVERQIENYNEREKYWIEKYNSIAPNGYNLLPGGEEPPIMKGFNHPESCLSAQDVEDLTFELQQTDKTFIELAKKYGFKSNTSISEFNKGLTYVRNIEYPIRPSPHNGKLSQTEVDEIYLLLKYTYRSYESIGQQYGVEARAISRINRGIFHKKDNEIYPLREGKIGSVPPKLTYEQVTSIISQLQSTSKSLREIARDFDVDYKDILDIKNGTTKLYRRRGIAYPLRPNN
jgi:group I intron endonuclease